eukprot:CAMPEP_0181312056 /NCGR_PEP_ID=MMETSP1101-20121128/13483_1 /TAXON_ID=46948 /ORGANISM="Rhodomonas abbreviata, Strain Caron Lab Isolate" /LENGTH=316 /DNA_ID=CAMNT_0023418861 /DNA_START=300 /DNA_END=1251 /DNA_ORIENTATION=+
MRLPFTKKERGVYILLGYFAPLAGSILAIVFMAMHGSKFGPHSVPVRSGNHTVLKDGPPESLLLLFWLLTCLQMVLLVSNLVGPCSCERRMHFPSQVCGVMADSVYLGVANYSIRFWPHDAQVQDPLLYFNVSACLMLGGQLTLAWGALRLSGSGYAPPRGELSEAELVARRRRRAMFNPVWYSDAPQGARVSYDYVDTEDSNSDVDVLDEEADEILALYPHTITSQMLEESGGMEACAFRSDRGGYAYEGTSKGRASSEEKALFITAARPRRVGCGASEELHRGCDACDVCGGPMPDRGGEEEGGADKRKDEDER